MRFLISLCLIGFSASAFAGEALIGDAVKIYYDASTQSSALTAPAGAGGIQKYRIVASTAAHFIVGANPTADSTGTFLPANVVDYVLVPSGQKIAAIKGTGGTAGFVTITKVDKQ